jgi:transposase-like protein
MNTRIAPSEKISKEIKRLIEKLDQRFGNEDLLGRILQLGMAKIVQETLEEETKEYLGRDYYQRKETAEHQGYRNGYKPGKLRTAEGKVTISKPQVSDSPEPFHSHFWEAIRGNTAALEHLAVEMYARGCSTRDVEELLKDPNGNLLLSKSSISTLSDGLWEAYEEFCQQDLSRYPVVYLFVDAVYEAMRRYKTGKEGILVAWCILEDGVKLLLGMKLGNRESYQDWLDFFRDLQRRGLKSPVLAVSDGAPGLIRALEECFPQTLRERCLVHKKMNILGKLPAGMIPEMKVHLNAVYYAPDLAAGRQRAEELVARYQGIYPSAVKCFQEDLEACLHHLRCPVRHRRFITSTNLVERSFEEEKRRSKVLPRFFNEKSCLKLAFASLLRASWKWRRIPISQTEQRELLELRYQLGQLARPEKSRIEGPPVLV